MKWPVLKLEQLASSEPSAIKIGPFGSQLKKSELVDFGIHVVGIENILANKFDELGSRFITEEKFSSLRSVEVKPGDVLITMMGTVGKIAIVPPGTGVSIMDSHLLRFRPNDKLCSSEYIAWLVKGSPATRMALHGRAHGAIMKGLNSDIIRSLPAPLPSFSEQRRIIDILDQADALRKKRAEADAKAESILPALFYKMFGDPAKNPMAWPTVPIQEVSLTGAEYGANASAIDWLPGMPRYVRITDIQDNGRLRCSDLKSLSMEDWHPYELKWGDLLFARSGATVGKTYLYQPSDGLCAFAGYLIRFRLDQTKIDPWYAFAFTRTRAYQLWLNSKRRIAAQPNINGQEYASLRLPKPPFNLQQSFGEAASESLRIGQQQVTAQGELEGLFKAMLHSAFSGDLTAKWREVHMKELLQEMEQQAKALQEAGASAC